MEDTNLKSGWGGDGGKVCLGVCERCRLGLGSVMSVNILQDVELGDNE